MTERAKKLLLLYYEQSKKNRTIQGSPPLTFKGKGKDLKNYRIYGNTVNSENVGDLITEGEHAGEYSVPVTVTNGTDTETTNLYLPEPLKMVGDEAEYIDYREQKMHRVRKNLLQNTATSQTRRGITFTVNTDGSITCSGILKSDEYADLVISGVFLGDIDILENGNYIVSCANGSNNTSLIIGNSEGEVGRIRAAEKNISANLTWAILRIYQANPAITLYPMIRKADIEDDTYEPYIEDTELDVTLPALPTLSGTNTLSVGTTVKPSKVEINGKINAVQEGGS